MITDEEREKIGKHNVAIAEAGSFYWVRGTRNNSTEDLMIVPEKIMEANLMAMRAIDEPITEATIGLQTILSYIRGRIDTLRSERH